MTRNDAEPTAQTSPESRRALSVAVVAHTHWDREWYHSAERFRARLVALVDALLARGPEDGSPFLLDGQAIVLEDYLAVRPDCQPQIAAALRDGHLEAGPWLVLADNLIPCGESIVRNLEAGRRALDRLGAASPRVMYCPDTFGHPAALPAIAAGFGFELAVVWRGFGGAAFPITDTAWWEAPNGAQVLLYHLPPDGYEFGSALSENPNDSAARWRVIRDTLGRRNQTGVALLTVGADHHAPPAQLPTAIAALAAAASDCGDTIARTSLALASESLLSAARRMSYVPRVHGELRDSYGYTWTLQGTYGTRAAQKRANARLERDLLRDVEPWQVLAWLHGGKRAGIVSANGEVTLAQLPTLTDRAWESLLVTHPHDTLCGCSIDTVAHAMTDRQRAVAGVIPELREAALAMATGHDRLRARAYPVVAEPVTIVRNRCAYPRGGVAEIRLLETLADVAVGPQSGAAASPLIAPLIESTHEPPSMQGYLVQPGASRVRYARRESPQHYPDNDLVREHRVLAWVPHVPSLGVAILGSGSGHAPGARIDAPNVPATLQQLADTVVLDNGKIRVVASLDGVRVQCGARTLDRAITLVTQHDAGDSYTPSLRGAEESFVLESVQAGAPGPLRVSVRLRWRWSHGAQRVRVDTTLSLDADAEVLRCDVRGWNARRNHRLQLRLQSDVPADARESCVMADAAFGPVTRAPIAASSAGAVPFEIPPSTMPLHRWMSSFGADRGVTVFSDGLAEGEVSDSSLGVTLVRAIGELSKSDLPERPGHAGWPCAIPHAQSQGRFSARLGLMLHGPQSDSTLVEIERAADTLLLPLIGESCRDAGVVPLTRSGPELRGDGLAMSSVRCDSDTGHVVLRAVNITDSTVRGAWYFEHAQGLEWRRCRLDGMSHEPWSPLSEQILFVAAPRDLVTMHIRRRPSR